MSEQNVTLHMSTKRAQEKKKIRSKKAERKIEIEIKHSHAIMDKKLKGVLDQYGNTMVKAIVADMDGD